MRLFGNLHSVKMLHDLKNPEGRQERCIVLFQLIFSLGSNQHLVDYDQSINKSNKIRSSTGISVDLLTPVGPLNFSLSQPLSKASTDKTEKFRFNLGTTF